MRPPGVRQRIRQLSDSEWEYLRSRPERLLRVSLTSLINLCARQRYHDDPVIYALEKYQRVCSYLDDPSQARTHSDFETKSIACVMELRAEIGQTADKPLEDISFDEQDALHEPLVRIPPRVILGEVNPDCYFHLICWNQANSLIEGFRTPYLAARAIANMDIHEPADPFGLITPLDELAMRYEDYPDERARIAEEITARLSEFVSRAPWGRSDSIHRGR